MRNINIGSILIACVIMLAGCGGERQEYSMKTIEDHQLVMERLAMFADTEISVDLSGLSERQRALIDKLIEAGRIVDELFWMQSSHDAIAVRDSLRAMGDAISKDILKYVMLHYGPYDRIFEGERFIGEGPARKPAGAGFYPEDMTREEFEAYISANPDKKELLESQYTVVLRDGDGLRAVPYHEYYPRIEELSRLLSEAAELADNPSLRKYLSLRAKAIATDDYFESDMAWMDIRDNDIDVVIGPIENYEDGLFNYKTAWECAVMVKDPEGSKELQMFTDHIDAFEQALPIDAKYRRASAGSANVLEIVNIVYFGGDFHAGIKTIAASLPNDPRVTERKGGKKQMYRNLMEAKFDKILLPIAERILHPALHSWVDRNSFTSFVTLHEVSHTLGMPYVYGKPELSVRRALMERYSAVEECKADVLGMYNKKLLLSEGRIDENDLKRSIVTYVAGLFRSLRFGAESAHGHANLVQLNWLLENAAVTSASADVFDIDFDKFMPALTELARTVLMIQTLGNYDEAGALLDNYGRMTDVIERAIDRLTDIPRDLNTTYSVLGK